MQPPGTSPAPLQDGPVPEASTTQFLVSGETESFGSNNLMGQWLKAIGGYTVEQIGARRPRRWNRALR